MLILIVLTAVAVIAGLAASRVVRVNRGHEAKMEGFKQVVLMIALLFVPPIVVQILARQAAGPGAMDGVTSILVYVLVFVALLIGMWVLARYVPRMVSAERRPGLLLALTGRETALAVPFDPPMSTAVNSGVELVVARNAAFPRGSAFMNQTQRPDFVATWAALDGATRDLEGMIADAGIKGTGIAQRAIETAADARGRLESLRRDAAAHGQSWAV